MFYCIILLLRCTAIIFISFWEGGFVTILSYQFLEPSRSHAVGSKCKHATPQVTYSTRFRS